MNFKRNVPIPTGVLIEKFFDTQVIDNGTSQLNFFPPNPSGNETDNNYTQNPFPEAKNYVILGISLNPTLSLITQDANIDPVLVVNTLKDATIKLATNQGRDTAFTNSITDYMNFNALGTALTSAASNDATTSLVALGSTGVRTPDNLFYLKPQETFTFKSIFNASVWPTIANWAAQGRFAIKATFIVAKMNNAQLQAYADSLGERLRS